MKRYYFIFGIICLLGLSSCNIGKKSDVLLSRSFPTSSWERFDFITCERTIEQPTTYNLSLTATFNPSYPYDHISLVFTVFDEYDSPFRSKEYKFRLKEKDGSWKSTLEDNHYRFTLPINSELTINTPGKYKFQLESHMPITPLTGIEEIAIINK